MATARIFPFVPDSPHASRNPFYEPGISERMPFENAAKVGRLVALVRQQIGESVSERDMLLVEDPETGCFFRSSFRVTLEGASEFEYRRAQKIVNYALSPAARVKVLLETDKVDGERQFAIVVHPKERAYG
jgi:hypothetical protein